MSPQQRHKKIAISAAIAGVIAATLIALYFAPLKTELTTIPETQEDKDRNDALGVAQRFIVTTPTFAFDGDINTLDTEYVGATKSIPPQYIIRISFNSSHGGYGDRQGQMLTQAITPHTMEIIVLQGKVISAVTDQIWDELNNHEVTEKPSPKLSSSDETTTFEGEVSDYSSLVLAIKSRGILVEPVDELEDSFFSVPTKVISVSGSDVQVYEFQSSSDAVKASQIISADGGQIGNSMVRWMDTPHFYLKGKVIVQYVGHNPEMTNLFESLLGIQFAGM